jgi:hypothetical protein
VILKIIQRVCRLRARQTILRALPVAVGGKPPTKQIYARRFVKGKSFLAVTHFGWRAEGTNEEGFLGPAEPSGTQKVRYAAGRAELRHEKEARPLRSE